MPWRTGSVVSTTVIWNEPVAWRPPESVAVQVIVFGPSDSSDPIAGRQAGVGATASSASVAVTVYAASAPPVVLPSTVESAGSWSCGGVGRISVTWTANEAAAVLPEASVAVQVTGVSPTGTIEPDTGAHWTVGAPSTMSVAVGGVYVSVEPPGSVVVRATSPGMPWRTGSVVSTTVIWNEPVAWRPPESVAVQVIVFGPSDSSDPIAGRQAGVGATASSASVAVTVYAARAPPVVLPSTVESAGSWSCGGVGRISATWTANEAAA